MSVAVYNMDHLERRLRFASRVMELRGPYKFKVTKFTGRGSNPQMRYYRGGIAAVFGDFLRQHGNEVSNEQAHELLGRKFLKREVVYSDGTVGEYTESTTRLETQEFTAFIEQCTAWLAGLGCQVLSPDEYHAKTGVA